MSTTVKSLPRCCSSCLTVGHILLPLCCSPHAIFGPGLAFKPFVRSQIMLRGPASLDRAAKMNIFNTEREPDGVGLTHTHRSTQCSSGRGKTSHLEGDLTVFEMEPQIPVCKSPHIRAPSSSSPLASLEMWTCLHIQNRTQTLEGRGRNAGAATVETFLKVVQHNPSPQRILCTLRQRSTKCDWFGAQS